MALLYHFIWLQRGSNGYQQCVPGGLLDEFDLLISFLLAIDMSNTNKLRFDKNKLRELAFEWTKYSPVAGLWLCRPPAWFSENDYVFVWWEV